MKIKKLVTYCDEELSKQDKSVKCSTCKTECNNSCANCLEEMHFRVTRRYNCINMGNCYVCRYIYKYSSEIEHLFNNSSSIFKFDEFKVLSFGCGPCTDLFGLSNFIRRNELDNSLSYLGIDLNEKWENIHSEVSLLATESKIRTKFVYEDVFKVVDNLHKDIEKSKWKPNILIFQYVISDMIKYNNHKEMKAFLKRIIDEILSVMDEGSYVVFNDINHCNTRDYFDTFITLVGDNYKKSEYICYHFNNNVRARHFEYGYEHPDNCITTSVPEEIEEKYSPWKFCSSAQLIIQVRS